MKMKQLLISSFIICLLVTQASCQNTFCDDVKYYNINDVEYVIFSKYEYFVNKSYPEYKYTKFASIDKVLEVDSLAFVFVKRQKNMPNQGFDGCPIIKDSWEDYCRQVICYLEKKGRRKYDEIIRIQYIHNSEIAHIEDKIDWKKNWVFYRGGCSLFFNISYNVSKRKIVDFVVN